MRLLARYKDSPRRVGRAGIAWIAAGILLCGFTYAVAGPVFEGFYYLRPLIDYCGARRGTQTWLILQRDWDRDRMPFCGDGIEGQYRDLCRETLQRGSATPGSDQGTSWPPDGLDVAQYAVGQALEGWIWEADVIAAVKVAEVAEARFDTPDGRLPSEPDPSVRHGGLLVYRPVVLQLSEIYKGESGASGFVVGPLGGEVDGFRFSISPQLQFTPGSHGIVFLASFSADPEARPYAAHLQSIARDLSAEGSHYEVMRVSNWYEFSSHGSTATSTIDRRRVDSCELLAEIEAHSTGPD